MKRNGNILERRKEKRELHKDIIETIIYFAAKEQKKIPAIKELLLSEIILGACDYLSVKKETNYCGTKRSWEEILKGEFPEIIEQSENELHPELKELLINISLFRKELFVTTKKYDDIFYDLTDLHLMKNDCFLLSLPAEFFERIEKEVIRDMEQAIVDQCKKIGKKMVKYISRDIERYKNK